MSTGSKITIKDGVLNVPDDPIIPFVEGEGAGRDSWRGNINYETGHAIFEAAHGPAPRYADLDKVNPGSVVLSGCMMLRYLGWVEAADAIEAGIEKSIDQKHVTYDFARMMDNPTEVKGSGFADALISNL